MESARLPASDGRRLRFGSYPAPFAGGTIALGARRVPARFFFGFDRALPTALFRLAMNGLRHRSELQIVRLARFLLPVARGMRWLGTTRGLLAVVAEDAVGREIARVELAANERGLDVPAAPPTWVAARLARGGALPGGARELCEVIGPEDVLSWVRAEPQLRLHTSGGVTL